MSDAEKKLEKIENIVSHFIESLGHSTIKTLDDIDPETKTAFMLEVLKTLHEKNAEL